MTRKECDAILVILNKIKNPNPSVELAKLYITRQLLIFDNMKGQLKEMGEPNFYL